VKKEIYVVMGTTGEYSDREEWPVCAFYDEEKAKERVVLAEQRVRELILTMEYHEDDVTNEYDKYMRTDYTGTSYFYAKVDIEE